MEYNNIVEAKFIDRVNRFIAKILINNKIENCHIKNTGRCKELFLENAIIFVQKHNNKNRKTKYSLISIFKENMLINIDSQIPNYIILENINLIDEFKNVCLLKKEVKYKNSRFDIYFERSNGNKGFIEVKGVTLEKNGVALFPDAPSKRAIKHLNELVSATYEGYESYLIFVIQMESVKYFSPNTDEHKDFSETLKKAKENNVNILAYNCFVFPNKIELKDRIKIKI